MVVDARTVREAQAGDRDALGAIVDEFTPTVLGAAYGLCGSWDVAGDIAQETFATMLVRLGDLREPAALPGWLLAVVRTAARRERRPVPTPRPSIGDAGPEDVVVDRDEAARVRRAVEALPPDLRLPMVLHYFAGLPLAAIGELCELPLSTIKQRMRVARARLREGIDQMECDIGPETDPTDVIRMYTAMRSGDVARVAAILDVRPDLVDARESWSRDDSFAHRLPLTKGGGTPLLRAVERGDLSMVRLLLDRGANADDSCTCDAGESAVWVAALQRETPILEELLRRGADPNVTAGSGASALEVAGMRGYDDVIELLVAAGATPSDVERFEATVPSSATGIKAVDLWCPFPERGLVTLTPGFGLGAVVLIDELSYRASASGRRVVWTGFAQAPTDHRDMRHSLAEAGISDRVQLVVAPPTAPAAEQIAALDAGIAAAGNDAFLVVFAETGRLSAVEERLPALAARDAVTLVVAPLDGSVPPPNLAGSPYVASIEFDVERARAGRWPAISERSWSKVGDTDLARRARAGRTDALDDYLTQAFYVAEPLISRGPGVSVTLDELHATVEAMLAQPLPVAEMGSCAPPAKK
jgi:RNA polymerase sigma factor (sigma-70 family)